MQKILVKYQSWNDSVLRKLCTIDDQTHCGTKWTEMGRLDLSWLMKNITFFFYANILDRYES